MAMAYPPYDAGISRSMSRMSRRPSMQSMNYGPGPGTPYFPEQRATMYAQPGYDMQAYGTPHSYPLTRRMSGQSYDDLGGTPYYPPPPPPVYPTMTHPVMLNTMPRRRRHSTVSFTTPAPRPNGMLDGLFGRSSIRIKFKRKGSLLGGINLAEAQMRGIRLSGSESYYLSDMHPSRYDNVYLKVRWPGHQECTYQIPLDSYDNGRLDLETLARRVARSCVHYFQTNRIPVSWDRMELKYLDELTFGVWEPQLTINHIL